jgi:hypothetical protein
MENAHPTSVATSAADRRAWVRHDCLLPSHGCHYDGNDFVHWQGLVFDLSQGGAQILLNRPFDAGATLEVEFDSPKPLPVVRARVVHVVEYSAGNWLAGCLFDPIVSLERLDAILKMRD